MRTRYDYGVVNRIALIDGKKVPYDMCNSLLLKEYPHFIYIGTGTIHSINDVVQSDVRTYTFFKMNVHPAIDDIMDVIGGAAGGIPFIKFKNTLESLNYQAEAGDAASIKIIEIVKQFARLVTL
jgi:hypothetical protein